MNLLNILITIIGLGFLTLCGTTLTIWLKTPAEIKLKKGTKAYYIYWHGQFVFFGLNIIVTASLVVILVLWLADNINLGF